MKSDFKGPVSGTGRVGYSCRWNQIHLPDNCVPPSALSTSIIAEVIPKILYRVQLRKANVSCKPVHDTIYIVKCINKNEKKKNFLGFRIWILALLLASYVTLGKSFKLQGPQFPHLTDEDNYSTNSGVAARTSSCKAVPGRCQALSRHHLCSSSLVVVVGRGEYRSGEP